MSYFVRIDRGENQFIYLASLFFSCGWKNRCPLYMYTLDHLMRLTVDASEGPRPQSGGTVDVLVSLHVKGPARNLQTSTILVLSANYSVLLLGHINKRCTPKMTSNTKNKPKKMPFPEYTQTVKWSSPGSCLPKAPVLVT